MKGEKCRVSAGICVMNRNAISMAADSAVTIGEHITIHNSANKLFSLSKVAPVGMIMYANGMLMNVPMEIIIKDYKKRLKKKTYDYLKDYVDDFLGYISANAELLRFSINEESYVISVFMSLVNGLLGDRKNCIEDIKSKKKAPLTPEELRVAEDDAIVITLTFIKEQPIVSYFAFEQYVREKYKGKFIDVLSNIKDFSWINNEKKEVIADQACKLFDTRFDRDCYVGVAIAGYGEKEIFPSLTHLHISGWIDGKLRFTQIETVEINERQDSSIIPLAQTDVMQTFLFGINDTIVGELSREIPNQIITNIDSIDDSFFATGSKDDLKKQLVGITGGILKHLIQSVNDNYMRPVIKSVATLPIEELGLLAESMINITSVRRKVALDRNVGTVGGPIDVAIITKGDGFIWLKRKHYFDRKYNPQYFYSHFEKDTGDEEDE